MKMPWYVDWNRKIGVHICALPSMNHQVPLINETNLCAIWEMAHENQLSGLLKHCKSFFISHFQACVAHPSFTSIRKSLLHEVRRTRVATNASFAPWFDRVS